MDKLKLKTYKNVANIYLQFCDKQYNDLSSSISQDGKQKYYTNESKGKYYYALTDNYAIQVVKRLKLAMYKFVLDNLRMNIENEKQKDVLFSIPDKYVNSINLITTIINNDKLIYSKKLDNNSFEENVDKQLEILQSVFKNNKFDDNFVQEVNDNKLFEYTVYFKKATLPNLSEDDFNKLDKLNRQTQNIIYDDLNKTANHEMLN